VTAQEGPAPTERAVTPLVRPVTCTGIVLYAQYALLVKLPFPLPFPSQPFSPQHSTAPAPVIAQADSSATDTAVTPLVRPVTDTGTELFELNLAPC
jgi:hypothetical protein